LAPPTLGFPAVGLYCGLAGDDQLHSYSISATSATMPIDPKMMPIDPKHQLCGVTDGTLSTDVRMSGLVRMTTTEDYRMTTERIRPQ
jgi:hypothetical protein